MTDLHCALCGSYELTRRPFKTRCGARRKSDGQPCQAQALEETGRCKLHGGMSTGAKSLHGRLRSLAGLWQYADCRKELLAIATAIEKGKPVQPSIDRFARSKSPYAGSAMNRLLQWMKSDIAIGMGH